MPAMVPNQPGQAEPASGSERRPAWEAAVTRRLSSAGSVPHGRASSIGETCTPATADEPQGQRRSLRRLAGNTIPPPRVKRAALAGGALVAARTISKPRLRPCPDSVPRRGPARFGQRSRSANPGLPIAVADPDAADGWRPRRGLLAGLAAGVGSQTKPPVTSAHVRTARRRSQSLLQKQTARREPTLGPGARGWVPQPSRSAPVRAQVPEAPFDSAGQPAQPDRCRALAEYQVVDQGERRLSPDKGGLRTASAPGQRPSPGVVPWLPSAAPRAAGPTQAGTTPTRQDVFSCGWLQPGWELRSSSSRRKQLSQRAAAAGSKPRRSRRERTRGSQRQPAAVAGGVSLRQSAAREWLRAGFPSRRASPSSRTRAGLARPGGRLRYGMLGVATPATVGVPATARAWSRSAADSPEVQVLPPGHCPLRRGRPLLTLRRLCKPANCCAISPRPPSGSTGIGEPGQRRPGPANPASDEPTAGLSTAGCSQPAARRADWPRAALTDSPKPPSQSEQPLGR